MQEGYKNKLGHITGILEKNRFKLLFVLSAVLLNVKYIFLDFGVDASFQTTMAYRLATGDKMFVEMWEPYQMSAFVCAFFIKIYLVVFGNTTGIVIYLQTIGVILDAIVCVILYRTILISFNDSLIAFGAAWLCFVISPKDVPIAEYTNMLVWFSILCFCMLIRYLMSGKIVFLSLSGLAMCGLVLSYPSAIIVYFMVVMFMIIEKNIRN